MYRMFMDHSSPHHSNGEEWLDLSRQSVSLDHLFHALKLEHMHYSAFFFQALLIIKAQKVVR